VGQRFADHLETPNSISPHHTLEGTFFEGLRDGVLLSSGGVQ